MASVSALAPFRAAIDTGHFDDAIERGAQDGMAKQSFAGILARWGAPAAPVRTIQRIRRRGAQAPCKGYAVVAGPD